MHNYTPHRQFRPGFRSATNGRQFRPAFRSGSKDISNAVRSSSASEAAQKIAIAEKDTALLPALPGISEHLQAPSSLSRSSMLPRQFVSPISAAPLSEYPFLATSLRTRSSNRRRWSRTVLIALIIVGILLALTLASLWLSSRADADVTLVQVQKQQVAQLIGGGGTLYPRQQLNITYPIAERVLAVLVHAGDQVASDQALLRLDTTQLNAQLKQAADNMAAAQDYLSTVSISGNAVTIAQAQQQLMVAKNKYTTLVTQSEYPFMRSGNLISPLSGVVTAVNINTGEILAPNTILLVIMDESALVVHMQVPLQDVGQVQVGAQAQVTPSASANRSFSGTVSAVIPRANPQTDTFEVWVNVNDPQHLLLPGMSAFVRILLPATAIVVPRLSVMTLASLTVVFVVREQHAYLRPVQIVGRLEDRLLVSAGLKHGEYIVLVGVDQLRDGQSVHVSAIEHSERML